jgi:hypothetical protein
MRSRASILVKLTTLLLAPALLFIAAVAPQGAVAATTFTWTKTGDPGNAFKYNIVSLAQDPVHNVLYAGTDGHGVWKYSYSTWTSTGGGVAGFRINSLAYDTNHNVLYAGCFSSSTGDKGVWKYNGSTWTSTGGALINSYVPSLVYDPAHNLLYAGTGEDVWKFDGSTWTYAGTGMPTLTVKCLSGESSAFKYNILYAGTDFGHGVWRYNGTTWASTGGSVSSYTVNALCFNTIGQYAGYAGTTGHGVWRWNGAKWTSLGGGVSNFTINSLCYDSSTGRLFAGTEGHGVWAYYNNTWTDTSPTPNRGVAGLTINALTSAMGQALYAGTAQDGAYTTFFSPDQPTTSVSYMAEGTTAWGFASYLSIENTYNYPLQVSIGYLTSQNQGKPIYQYVTLPAQSQTTINPANLVKNMDWSAVVYCQDQTKTISVDRTMFWTGTGAPSQEGHNSVGVSAPANTWYLPEGCSAFGFETWLLIQNPNSCPANCKVTYMIEGEAPRTISHAVPAKSRQTYDMGTDIGQKNASIKVDSDVPVIPERSVYRNNRREGSDSIGTTTPSNDYFLAEGTSAWGFTTYVLIQNPNPSPSNVTLTYMTPSGPRVQPAFSLAGNSRKTIKVNDVAGMGNTDFSTQVHGTQPIIAERSMYWGMGTSLGEACHDSIGLTSAHTAFYLPDGQTSTGSSGYETWTLVQNPNTSAVTVEISYLKSGGGAVTFTDSIPANSRKTYKMADKIPSGRASVRVTSKTAGKKIMVERAMYWNNRGAGTDSIGGCSD